MLCLGLFHLEFLLKFTVSFGAHDSLCTAASQLVREILRFMYIDKNNQYCLTGLVFSDGFWAHTCLGQELSQRQVDKPERLA